MRPYGAPGGFDRFSRERRGRSPRGSFSSSRFRGGLDRHLEMKRRASDLRGRLAPKRSWSDSLPSDDTSKFKRHRRSSQDDSDTSERKDKPVKKESSEKDDSSDKEDIVTEALYCHMCKHGNFTSVKTYLFHLDGVRHKKTAVAFHAKNEATLEYLRKNAKLASIRFGGLDNTVTPSRCSICTALVKESFYKHKKLLEHRLVKKFLKPKCCDRFFKTRYDMDEHRLSLPHLKKVHKSNETQKLLMEEVDGDGLAKWNHEEAIKHLKSKNPLQRDDLTLENIPPFDGNNFIGVDILEPRDSLLCRPCQTLLPLGLKILENHMASIDHYNAVVDYLREKKRRSATYTASDKTKETKKAEDEDEEEDEDDDDAVAVEVRSTDDEGETLPCINDTHIVLEEVADEDPSQKEGEDQTNQGNDEEATGDVLMDEDFQMKEIGEEIP